MDVIEYILQLGMSAVWLFASAILFIIYSAITIKSGESVQRTINLTLFALLPLPIGLWGTTILLPTLIRLMVRPDTYNIPHATRPLDALNTLTAVFLMLVPLVCKIAKKEK